MSYQQFGHVDPNERLDYAEDPPPGDEEPPRRRLPAVLLVAGVVAIFGGGLWFAYHQGTKHAGVAASSGPSTGAAENVPLIRAGTEPVKVKPEKAGG